MAEKLSVSRCFIHKGREAVARCPECKRFFCRECVTEHEDRMLCTSCLKRKTVRTARKKFPLALVSRAAQAAVGFMILWMFFFYMGRALLSISDTFHEGTFWEEGIKGP